MRSGLFLLMVGVFSYVIVEVFQSRAVKLADLLELLLYFQKFQLRKILMEIFWDGFAGGLEDGVPVVAVIVAREWKFVHYEGVLHDRDPVWLIINF